jgi:hypothetical protein|tara:strand:+ start:122 stop:271 length:150 start_codon:yes stop_codon:yes gene_type:complete
MAVIYKPSHKFLGQNAISIEYELRKLSQKLSDLDDQVSANTLNIFGKRD